MTTVIESRLPMPRHNAITAAAGVLRRVLAALLDAMEQARQRQAERTIARYAAVQGGLMTDEFEREITRRLSTADASPRPGRK